MVLTDEQRHTLETFINDSLAGGVRMFSYPKTAERVEFIDVRLVPESESALYTESALTNELYKVILTLEVMP